MKIDRRISYKIMLDTETCNTHMGEDGRLDMSNVLVYDIGWQVVDKRGRVYEAKSYIVKEIFFNETELMKSAYYARKIPRYLEDIANGSRIVASFYEIRKDLLETMERYEISTVVAHNARFDYNALNTTQRWLTKSKYRYFLPKNTEIWDTMKMASDTICQQVTYKRFCEENGFMTSHKIPQVRKTAEILYRYISGDIEFEESHTGLEDVQIETMILAHCFRQHKKMRKNLWEKG